MPGDDGPDRIRRSRGFAAFQALEAQARLLRRSIYFLVVLIAVLPPVVFTLIERQHQRVRALAHARHVAELIDSMPQATPEGLRPLLQKEKDRDALLSIRLLGAGGAELVRVGDREGLWVDSLALPASAAPYREVAVSPTDATLKGDLLRVVLIHLLVGLVLGLGVYRVPVRAFGEAIEELKAAQAQVAHSGKLSALGEMYAGLTHEVNNPLGILLARVKLLQATAVEKGLDTEARHDLEVIERSGSRIAEIVRSLLAFARKADFAMRPADLNQVIKDAVALVEKPFSTHGIRIEAHLDPRLPALHASPDHLQQVFVNLLNNARDAMPAGGAITLRTFVRDGLVVAEVEDTGSGLAPEVHRRLFEPFFTTKAVGKGTGLGLSVSYGIVTAHGGEIEAESARGKGALFRLILPAAGGSSG